MSAAKPVALVGMMGSGKSTVARLLARRLGVACTDLDAEIEKAAGMTIAAIFKAHGEQAFRQMEDAALRTALSAAALPGGVIATGGGVVLNAENRALLREKSTAVYLCAATDALAQRLAGEGCERPLLKAGANAAPDVEYLQDMLARREPLYRAVAHITVAQGGNETPLQISEAIYDALKKSVKTPFKAEL